jgi:predicted Zn finger-like uncharacterized protein
MANVISCPKCERQLRVPDDLLGESVKCPSCSETFTAALPKNDAPSKISNNKANTPPPDDDEEDRPSRRRPIRRDEDDDDDDGDDRRSRRRRLTPHRGDTIQLLGILSFFLVPHVLGPMAWIMGNGDLREMDAGRMDPAGRKSTETGRLCGKISTIIHVSLLALGLLFVLGCCCFQFMMVGAAGAGGAVAPGGPPRPVRRF